MKIALLILAILFVKSNALAEDETLYVSQIKESHVSSKMGASVAITVTMPSGIKVDTQLKMEGVIDMDAESIPYVHAFKDVFALRAELQATFCGLEKKMKGQFEQEGCSIVGPGTFATAKVESIEKVNWIQYTATDAKKNKADGWYACKGQDSATMPANN